MDRKIMILAKVYDDDQPRIAYRTKTQKEAADFLNKAFGPSNDGVWIDNLNQKFWIEEDNLCTRDQLTTTPSLS